MKALAPKLSLALVALLATTSLAFAATQLWELIQDAFVERENGEWVWGIDKQGNRINKEKAGPWKSSYHNSRACFEMISRIEKLKVI